LIEARTVDERGGEEKEEVEEEMVEGRLLKPYTSCNSI